MTRWMTVFALAGLLAAPTLADESYREIRQSIPAAPGQEIEIEFPIGDLRLEPSSGPTVEVEIEARCRRGSRCGLEDLSLDHRSTDRALVVRVNDRGRLFSNHNREVEATIRVPRDASIWLEMSIGELEIRDLRGPLDAKLGIGEARVFTAASALRAVHLDAGIGEARLRSSERVHTTRSRFIGSALTWDEGEGEATLDLEVGIGEATVYLD